MRSDPEILRTVMRSGDIIIRAASLSIEGRLGGGDPAELFVGEWLGTVEAC